MANKIDSTLPPFRQINGAGDTSRAHDDAKASGQTRSGDAAAGHDTVEVTRSARQLAALEQAIAASSVVDNARVDAVRSSIANGSYSVQSQQVADGLINMDQALPA